MPKPTLRSWQIEALSRWEKAHYRGIVSVVTGGGKTVFALACVDRIKPRATLVIVPTTALLEQWWEEVANYFDLDLDEVNIIDSRLRFKLGTINIAVLNTAAKLTRKIQDRECFLIVDECHRAASEQFSSALDIKTAASLGLSATPERPYDSGFEDVLIPRLGQPIFSYGYPEALRDGVIVPFNLKNVVFDLEEDLRNLFDRLTRKIAQSIQQYGPDAQETVALYLKRARSTNLSLNRVRTALKLVAANRGRRTLIFHEDIQACELVYSVLRESNVACGIYHSRLRSRDRAAILNSYRRGDIDVLVTCRALDEGFNVPETEVGIIAASTATLRQRIQRLGRVIRPSTGKSGATVYTLVATDPEIRRLKDEEKRLENVATISWSKA